MAHFRKHNRMLVPLLGAAFVAILLLATLQYSWVGEIDQGYRERMQANLNAGIQRFTQDFDRELALAYLTFQMDAETLAKRDWATYARRYDGWRANASYPQIVGDIYLVQIYAGRRPVLLHFDATKRIFIPISWPDTFLPLKGEMTGVSQAFAAGTETPAIAPVFADAPALVVPLSRVVRLSDDREVTVEADLLFGEDIMNNSRRGCTFCREMQRTPLYAYTLVTLNKKYVLNTFVPTLAVRHFGGSGTPDYNLTIVSRSNPGQVIYSSTRSQSGAPIADATASVLDIRLDSFSGLVTSADFADDPASQRADQLSDRLLIGIYGRDNRPNLAAEQGLWQVILTHREGSLDRAVASLRTRNLLVSSGVLLLLAASVVMIVLASRRAQRLARQQIEFVAAVSHELRTPLAVICSAGENLADGVVRDPQQTRQYGSVIHSEGRRLSAMVEQVLAFAGAQSQQRFTLAPLELRASVERALIACCPVRERDHYDFTLDIPIDLPPVLADDSALLRMLQNLIDNAMKYGGGANWVSISAGQVGSSRGSDIWICVRDRGPGIAAEDLPYIFEPFYRGRKVVQTPIHGSGLGLSLVRQLATTLGGRLEVESSAQGSAFTLFLPSAPEPLPDMVSLPLSERRI